MIHNLDIILRVMPREISNRIDADKLEEIRIRVNRKIILKYIDREEIAEYIPTRKRNFKYCTSLL